jgi:hypothetical protein
VQSEEKTQMKKWLRAGSILTLLTVETEEIRALCKEATQLVGQFIFVGMQRDANAKGKRKPKNVQQPTVIP